MLLENKSAVMDGAGGAIGGAIARAFAREGAKVFLAGRRLSSVDAVARDISNAAYREDHWTPREPYSGRFSKGARSCGLPG